MERVVKGLLGYGVEKESNTATHVILDVKEYNKLIEDIKKANADKEESINKFE